jgi:AcrR family transcriptional regulator
VADEKLDTQVRKEQIAAAALELVASQGIKRLNMAAIARRVGLVPSGIYRHFKSKDEVLDAVLELLRARLMANVATAREESADPLERLHGLLTRHVRLIREGRAFPRIIFSDEMFENHSERQARVKGILAQYLAEIGRLVQEGQQQGQICADVPPQTAAMMFMGIIIPAGILWHLTDGGFNVTQHAGRAWQMLYAALTGRRSGS